MSNYENAGKLALTLLFGGLKILNSLILLELASLVMIIIDYRFLVFVVCSSNDIKFQIIVQNLF